MLPEVTGKPDWLINSLSAHSRDSPHLTPLGIPDAKHLKFRYDNIETFVKFYSVQNFHLYMRHAFH
jgi:hypothetical protein